MSHDNTEDLIGLRSGEALIAHARHHLTAPDTCPAERAAAQ